MHRNVQLVNRRVVLQLCRKWYQPEHYNKSRRIVSKRLNAVSLRANVLAEDVTGPQASRLSIGQRSGRSNKRRDYHQE